MNSYQHSVSLRFCFCFLLEWRILDLCFRKDVLSNEELDTISLEKSPTNICYHSYKNHPSRIILIEFKVHDYATDTVHEAICVLTGDKLIITYSAKPVHREAVNIVKVQ